MSPSLGGSVWLGAALSGAAVVLLVAPSPPGDLLRSETDPARTPGQGSAPTARRALACGLAGIGVWLFLGGWVGAVLAPAAVVACWRVLSRAEPREVRRRRERAAAELPHLVGLLAAGLRAGAPPGQALSAACAALPGPAADSFTEAVARLELGVEPGLVWSGLAGEPGVTALGRALSRSHETGASVLDSIESLAQTLAQEARAGAEDRARTVGVRAALPLGLCLLPAFLLLGIVPVVVGMAAQLAWS